MRWTKTDATLRNITKFYVANARKIWTVISVVCTRTINKKKKKKAFMIYITASFMCSTVPTLTINHRTHITIKDVFPEFHVHFVYISQRKTNEWYKLTQRTIKANLLNPPPSVRQWTVIRGESKKIIDEDLMVSYYDVQAVCVVFWLYTSRQDWSPIALTNMVTKQVFIYELKLKNILSK